MRRIDAASNSQFDLQTAVRSMRDAAQSNSPEAEKMFDRVDSYQAKQRQDGPPILGHYDREPTQYLALMNLERKQRLEALYRSIDNLQSGDHALVLLGVYSKKKADSEIGGHAILIQRQSNGEYSIFDPNNGVFNYKTREAASKSLARYFNSAYSEVGGKLNPDAITVYRRVPASTPRSFLSSQNVTFPQAEQDLPLEPFLYGAHADDANGLTGAALLPPMLRGISYSSYWDALGTHAMRDVATGRASDLAASTVQLNDDLHRVGRGMRTLGQLNLLRDQSRYIASPDVPDRVRHGGVSHANSGATLTVDLANQFMRGYPSGEASLPLPNDFAYIDFELGEPASGGGDPAARHRPLIVQRLNPSSNYRNDRYQIYDPEHGVFTYRDYAHMERAVSDAFHEAYQDSSGVRSASVTYYAVPDDHARSNALVSSRPSGGIGNQSLSSIRERYIGASPPVPDFAARPQPPSVVFSPTTLPNHDEFKRGSDLSMETKPYERFRPSRETPGSLKARGGFESEEVSLQNVSLDVHDFDMASNPRTTDGAGYLSTFASSVAARRRLAAQGPNGYIYSVAPSPNMVSVNGSLGEYSRNPENQEVAAMGRIDYGQIRGWWQVSNGEAGSFVANPNYRSDIFDTTRTAGARPDLARFPNGDPPWGEALWRSYARPVKQGLETVGWQPEGDQNLTQANFYAHSLGKIRIAEERQSCHLDYRGPTTLWAGDPPSAHSGILLYVDGSGNVYDDYVYRSGPNRSDSVSQFRFSDDGRFHLANDTNRVLEVRSDGYVYTGPTPEGTGTNGVFRYETGHLIHVEDGKYLSIGKFGYQPYVSATDLGRLSKWTLTDPGLHPVTPPAANTLTYHESNAGDSAALREFERDPDTALPPGFNGFVTRVPSIDSNALGGSIEDFVQNTGAVSAPRIAEWLGRRHVALLLRDGTYLVPTPYGQLEAHRIDGMPTWRTTYDWTEHAQNWQMLGEFPPSRYSVPDDVWQLIQAQAARRDRMEKELSAPT
ncbi:enterotoxin A family protein [Caballeronia sp. LZ032]|uniref:enterotoxin A family protein n=1 Tax=Caballeronia sp. LZ032 TaxID=3038565 RepID=UPI002854CD06|nr:enterotoxin A family protein [Caballeronia sp. LZ032]MDR5881457.1 enterotoxin A family protein [Caballeronia sp. LZ032]